ncbi:MAG: CHAT domain-containing protein [Brasilonema angustatum HA4187-MV1]|jgi:CHAT domain-containing protein|nr:CHAT domain-containing protein [Brasilonema angustatum HA4187-MV1]
MINILDLGETAKAQELQRRGTDLLRRLLDDCKSPGKKKQLALKFAPFQQLTVDLAVQSGEMVQALELAEQGKNACLAWLLDAWNGESPAWEEMKQLLNPTTAIVYWHLSPAALHTFILKHDASSPILISPPSFASGVGGDFQSDELEVPAAARRLHEFENWVKEWNEQYASYCEGRDTLTLEDICQFNLSHYELVSLSACETAVTGNQTISTEYVGLVSGFVRQGVAHVVSTLWRVESVSSALFMMEFYRQLNRDIEPTTALRQTQIWLATVKYSELVQWYKDIAAEIAQSDSLCAEDLKDKAKIIEYDVEKINSFVPPYAHPYFWASFIITGTVSGLTH